MIAPFVGQSQNLVPNWSFEELDTCTYLNTAFPMFDSSDQVRKCPPWNSYAFSPDIFTPCGYVSPINSYDAPLTPTNLFGFQSPYLGTNYAGTLYTQSVNFLGEVIGCPLLNELNIGETYEVSFYISNSGTKGNSIDPQDLYHSMNKIGLKFLMSNFSSDSNPMPVLDTADIYTTNIVSDSIDWTLISGIFVADSAYTHIAIGQFFSNFQYQNNGEPFVITYYYLDNVCVTPLGGDCSIPVSTQSLPESAPFKLFPSPASSWVFVEWSEQEVEQLQVFDARGQLVLQESVSAAQSYAELNVSLLAEGLYVVLAYDEQGRQVFAEKLILER